MYKYNSEHSVKKLEITKIEEILATLKITDIKEKEMMRWYCEIFLQDTDPKEIAEFSVEALGRYIKMSRDFLSHRSFGKASVTIYSPEKQKDDMMARTIIEIVNEDMPFLVDSVTQILTEKAIDIFQFFHPVCRIKRDKDGNFIGFSGQEGTHDGFPESIMQVHISRLPNEHAENELKQKIEDVLSEVRKVTGDWQSMLLQVDEIIEDFTNNPRPLDKIPSKDVVTFLQWLGNNHFTFLGFREYRYNNKTDRILQQVAGSGLGLFRDPHYYVLRSDGDYVDVIDELGQLGQNNNPITVIKSNRKSNVHRFTHMDQIFITIYNQGDVVGQYCFIGLFTSTAYSARVKDVPLLNQKAQNIIERSGFRPTGHDGKALVHILDTYPRDELFQTDLDELYDIVMGIMKLEIRPTIKLFSRYDRFERFVSVMVYLPRERLDTDARSIIGGFLAEAFGGRVSNFSLWFSESNYVRIKYIIAVTPSSLKHPDNVFLETEIKRFTTHWNDSMREAMYDVFDDAHIAGYIKDYAEGFSPSYRESHSATDAVKDIQILETLQGTTSIIPHIVLNEAEPDIVQFRLLSAGDALPLSDCLPVFENFGFRVLTERPYKITAKGKKFHLQEFVNVNMIPHKNDTETVKKLLSEAFLSVYKGEIENDAFNKLVLSAGLTVHEITILRAFARYLKQTNISYSQQLIGECLVKHSSITRKIYNMFDILHNPHLAHSLEERQNLANELQKDIFEDLNKVTILDEDTIIRRMMNAVRCVLRTNVYTGKSYLAFKFDSAALQGLPLPRPFREIWVYSPRVEGVHLRFGKVARGGLRWSDRQEDFRTEVLSLVKAQQVKNAVIVPVGAKGGFYPKQLPDMSVAGRDAWLAEGIASYKIFISALLDVTDNIVKGQIIPPQNVLRYDEDDPYLVVAADKGTATFSDTANGLSEERGFWLDDAFASGGSVGYDHKKMGITAKGAWEAVKRHFRERHKDIQTEDFTVIGVGDMSGDVFGNGMLLSRKIHLVAAFDHRDIFIDPNPDAETSYIERERLFNLPRSSWQDYDKSLISKGGGIFSRSSKSIALTPEMKLLTGLTQNNVTPTELMTALLKADVDLLWFGGIGTYVKASSEVNNEVGDKANDALRINGADIRAKVIGEGANLGLTQKGRIEFALTGGAMNTDAVDNSAGVDCSDHEVNIKITLGSVVMAGKMSEEERNILLAKMTDEVSDLVLQTNYNQTLALSISQDCAKDRVQIHARFLKYLEKNAGLNRDVEYLPDEKTLLAGRGSFKGLTRPELAVMMAYSKLHLYSIVLGTTLPDDVYLEKIVNHYMPTPISQFKEALVSHPLRREIITTVLTNRAINEGGISFIFRLCERLNVTPEMAMRGYVVAREIMGLDDLLNKVHALDNKIPAELQIKLYEILRRSLFDQTRRILVSYAKGFDISETIAFYAEKFQTLLKGIEGTLGTRLLEQFQDFIKGYEHEALPDDLRKTICALYFMKNGCDIIALQRDTKADISDIAKLYFGTVEILGFDGLRRKATEIILTDVYDQMALSQIISDMDMAMYKLVALIAQSKMTPEQWCHSHGELVADFREVLHDAVAVSVLGLSRLSIITSALRQLSTVMVK